MGYGYEAIGFLAGSDGQIVILQCRCCGAQIRVSWADYTAGKYDMRHQ